MVGDRGMITSARIDALRTLDGMGWVTALRAPAIAALAADDGPLQMSLFDEANLAEIAHPDYPGERLVACRNPALAAERTRKRLALLDIHRGRAGEDRRRGDCRAADGRGHDRDPVREGHRPVQDGQALHHAHHRRHVHVRPQHRVDRGGGRPGRDLRGPHQRPGPEQMDPATVVATYKSLAGVERDFLSMKAIDLELRPIRHWTETRVRAHVFLCMLAAYLVWHLRAAWAPLTFTDEDRPDPADPVDPVAPAQRSPAAAAKASRRHRRRGRAGPFLPGPARAPGHPDPQRHPLRHRPDLPTMPTLTEATPTQRRAFELLGARIPLSLT